MSLADVLIIEGVRETLAARAPYELKIVGMSLIRHEDYLMVRPSDIRALSPGKQFFVFLQDLSILSCYMGDEARVGQSQYGDANVYFAITCGEYGRGTTVAAEIRETYIGDAAHYWLYRPPVVTPDE